MIIVSFIGSIPIINISKRLTASKMQYKSVRKIKIDNGGK